MDRYWLLTWTTYGTWLPGDERGFIGRSRDADGRQEWLNVPGTPMRDAAPRLERASRARMKAPPIWLSRRDAMITLRQFQITAGIRGWELIAVAIMRNHVHLVVGVQGDPDPATLLRDFKSYSSRALNAATARPPNGRWWTQSGSRRVLRGEEHLIAGIRYVLSQHEPLKTWHAPSLDRGWLISVD